jgi:competence protein ComEA
MVNTRTDLAPRRRSTRHILLPINILGVVLAFVTVTGVVSRASTQQEVDPAALPEGDGKALLYRLCSGCHDIPQVIAKRRTVKQWRELTVDMIARGEPAEEAEVEAVIDFCAQHVGYVNVNKASEADLKKYGGFTAAEATAILAARATGKTFESLDALKALPGIDAKTLAARSAKIAFKDR